MAPKIRNSNRGFVDSPHKIYAGNLGWRLTSQGLRDAFADQPGLLSAKVIYDRNSGRSRGFGFISFESAEAVESALNAMNGVVRMRTELLLTLLLCWSSAEENRTSKFSPAFHLSFFLHPNQSFRCFK